MSEVPALWDLDLSKSFISSWSEVSILCNQLKLHTLDLNYNLLPVYTLVTTDKHIVAPGGRPHVLERLHLGRYPHLCLLLLHALPIRVTDPNNTILFSSLSSSPPTLFSSLTELDL